MPSYCLYSFIGTVKELSDRMQRSALLAARPNSKAAMRWRYQLGWRQCQRRLKNKLFGLLYSPFNLLT